MRTSTRLWALLAAVALVGASVVHLRIADRYVDIGDHPISLGDQLYAQAGLGIAVALLLLVRPRPLVWAAAVLVSAASLGYAVYGLERCWPLHGYDGCFTQSWDLDEARAAVAFLSAAVLLSAFGWVSAVSAAGSRALPSRDAPP